MKSTLILVTCLAESAKVVIAYGSFVQMSTSFHSKIMKPEKRKSHLQGMIMFQDDLNRKSATNTDNSNSFTKIGDLVVPSVGIGTISWSSQSLTTLENLELQAVVKEAVAQDSAFFDTAERYGTHIKTALGLGYGETEQLLQKLISRSTAGENREENNTKTPIIATKFTPTPWRTTVDSVVEACEQSRRRLGVDQIDLYQLHMPDIVQPLRFLGLGKSKDEVYWKGLAECHRLGLVKNVGVSNYGSTLVERCQDTLGKYNVPLASNQIAYSLIGRQNGAQKTVDTCTKNGVKVLAYYPFAMGLLTGKYSSSLDSVSDATITSLTSSKKTDLEMKDLRNYANKMCGLLSEMKTIAAAREKTISQVALNYIMCKGAVPIPGARTIDQVKDNIGAMGWQLNESEIDVLESEADKLGFSFEGAGYKRTSEKFVGYGVEKWSLD